MKFTNVYLITFSPTQTSKRVGMSIVQGFRGEKEHIIDLTHGDICPEEIPSDALTVIALPVYGGYVPALALERMKQLKSQGGGPLVAVVVYGNRAYERALEELEGFATARGFKVIAGGTFIGEHSYSSDRYPISPGRPDADDLEYARLFGEKIRTKIEMASDSEHLYAVDVRKILRPTQPFFPLLKFLYKVSKFRKSGQKLPAIPQVNKDLCTQCGACVTMCPTGAIQKGDECSTLAEKCIHCCACVKGCPQQARTFDTPFASMLSSCFKREKEDRIIL